MQMRFGRALALGLAATAFAAAPALAVTVENRSDKSLEITADLGASEPKVNIEAGKSAKLDCPEGCEVRAVGLNSYGVSAKTGDTLMIKDGMLQAADDSADKGKAKSKTN